MPIEKNIATGMNNLRERNQEECRLLLVDDDQLFRGVLGEMLVREGYTVLTASGGQEAIDLLAKERVDLVLTDIYMPGISGFDVLRYVKQMLSKVKVVLITAYEELRIALEAKQRGADAFLGKMQMSRDLVSTIELTLNPPNPI